MIHIVFNEADKVVLEQAIKLGDGLTGEVVQIKDDFAVGPLHNIYQQEGIDARKDWWRLILEGSEYEKSGDKESIDDQHTMKQLIERLDIDPGEKIWIWAAQNKHDVSGYYWMLHYLKEYQGKVFILYLNNLPFINEKGNIFYPKWLHEIPAKEFLKARKLAREVTAGEFEVDPDEWNKLIEENKGVRLLEGGKKLIQEDFDFFDAELRKFVTHDWQKASKIIHQYLAKATHTTGDAYLLWRLKEMIAQDQFDAQGKIGGMKEFEVKTKG